MAAYLPLRGCAGGFIYEYVTSSYCFMEANIPGILKFKEETGQDADPALLRGGVPIV